jgi:hypothetical protein
VTLEGNRRQGLSSSHIDGLQIYDSSFVGNGGAAPGAGINLEADTANQHIKNVRIERSTFAGNVGPGLLIATHPAQRKNIVITGNLFEGKPIDGTDGLVPFYAKWLGQLFGSMGGYPWWFYPRKLVIP